MGECSAEGCNRQRRTRGLCSTHYSRELCAGRLQPIPVPTPEERFWRKVDKADGCWNWTGSKTPTGYGHFWFEGALRLAHRFSYEMHREPIPDGLVIDHLCRNPSCINPDHLEAVTSRENTLRGESPAARAARRDTCPKGHPLMGENLKWSTDGTRRCRTCDRAYRRARTLREQGGRSDVAS